MNTKELKKLLENMEKLSSATANPRDLGALRGSDITSGAAQKEFSIPASMYADIVKHAIEVGKQAFMATENEYDTKNYKFRKIEVSAFKPFMDIIELLPAKEKAEIREIVDFYPLYIDNKGEQISSANNIYANTLLACARTCIAEPGDAAAMGDYHTTLKAFRAMEDLMTKVIANINDLNNLETIMDDLERQKQDLNVGSKWTVSVSSASEDQVSMLDEKIGIIKNYLAAKEAFDDQLELVDKPHSKRPH